jgi:hypothetical protein
VTQNGSRGQPNADWRELNDGQILSGEFVISGRDTPHFRCSAHDVFDIYAIDYSPLSANFFWGEANIEQPPEGVDIARREAERFVDMDLGLSTAAD